ncbi:MAG: GNAT family N-acetyltransferase [Gemmatimonadales bacterium]
MDRRVTITYLEMRSPAEAVPYTRERRLEVRRAEIPSPELSRFLYVAVGSTWWWQERLSWDRDRWMLWLDRPEVETWIGYRSGTPAGYFELERQPGRMTEIAYFGLLPSFIGQGLGAELLSAAVERAWQLSTERVWVHTCTLDHPSALPNYEARGFRVYDAVEKTAWLPDVKPTPWPAKARR